MHKKILSILILTGIISISGLSIENAFAHSVSDTLFYTTHRDTPDRVYSIDFAYDGAVTFQLMNDTPLCSGIGADGIAQNPNNPDLLLIGGQGPTIHTCSKSTGITVPTTSTGPLIFHLEVPNVPANSVYGNGIPGQPVYFTINGDGTVNAGQPVTMGGSTGVITQLIDTPTGFFYGNNGAFGSISFATPISATTTQLSAVTGNSAHGGVYDPFTNTIITFGSTTVNQFDAAGNFLQSRTFPVSGFDQGTVDGNGHLFIASGSDVFFLDYSSDGNIATNSHFFTTAFVRNFLDDLAPLVGAGSTDPCVLEPTLPQCNPVGGEIIPIATTALILAGLQSSAIWMLPVLAGAAGVGAFYIKTRMNKE